MEVCQVCGSLLIMNDVQKRLEAHFEGKQHAGYQKVWEFFEEYKKKYPEVYRRLEGSNRRSYPPTQSSNSSSRNRSPQRRPMERSPRRKSPPRDYERTSKDSFRDAPSKRERFDERENRDPKRDRYLGRHEREEETHRSSSNYARRSDSYREGPPSYSDRSRGRHN